ncbi:DUF2357 domain-containing protein [Vibrio splendidus]|uniref:DUF2357 domain-containing protein n=1 Tax=Vibrio splendidus TaxID=29497 RepID=UPI00148C0A19|nr:DUF2357 domain-containing protein [Vibrio splendidus]NOJ03529.1 DUF2357 domain-containing protein [Vibrio splendidus]
MVKQKRVTIKAKHDDFTVYVTCDDIDSPLSKLEHTYRQRDQILPSGDIVLISVGGVAATFDDEGASSITTPFFFENRQYWFDIEFERSVIKNTATVNHKHRLIEEAFHLTRNGDGLQAAINFGNDVGNCSFNIEYQVGDKLCSAEVSFNIFATKMVMDQDLPLINRAIDDIYPLWRYSLSSKTSQHVSQSQRTTEKFELFWLAQFQRLVEDLQSGVKQVINSPHNRLQSFSKYQKLDRVNKRLNPKQAEKSQHLIQSGVATPRLPISFKKLHIDTPENRFIKMVINKVANNLHHLISTITRTEKSQLSGSFIQKVQTWQHTFNKMCKHQLWREVGTFKGQGGESKVLQQGTGYAKAYKAWQQLKYYLNNTNNQTDMSVKSVAELYEIWCFVEVMAVIKSLGFKEIKRELAKLKQVQFEKQFSKDGMAAAFEFSRDDGVIIKLAHEPTFSPKGEKERTWTANQRPDIVLQVTLENQESFLILFDAKYRIDNYQIKAHNKGFDAVPEDAINQMHRYRDAIIHQQKLENENPIKSRPVMGAFALYPGFCDQVNTHNPYQDAIDQIGIGAFALLPSANNQLGHNLWLKNYLQQKLGASITSRSRLSNDYYFIEDSARIAPYGSCSARYQDLTMVAPLNEIGRDDTYLNLARSGKLKGYHTQLLATNRQNVHRNIVREVRYLLITVRNNMTDNSQFSKYLYRVANVKLLPRSKISQQFTGKDSQQDGLYWFFEFTDEPIILNTPIEKPYQEHFRFKLTKAELLHQLHHWDDIKGDYQLYADLDKAW